MGSQPRVTRFKINWDDSEQIDQQGEQQECEQSEDISMLNSSSVTFNDNSQTSMEVI